MKSWILCALISLTSSVAWGANNEIAVLDIAGNGIDKNLLPTLTEMLTAEIDALDMYQVIAGRDVEAMLGFESERLTMGCDDASCLAEIGGALGVDRMVKPQIGRVGALYVVNIKVINIKLAKTEGRVYETVSGGDEALLATISRSIKRLLGPSSRTGKLMLAARGGKPAAAAATTTAGTAGGGDTAASGSSTITASEASSADGAGTSDGPTTVAATDEPAATVSKQDESSGGGVPILPIIVGGVGVAAAGVGFVFGAMAKDAETCAQAIGACVGSQNAIATAQTQSLLANVMFGVGGAGVAAAILLFVFTGGDDDGAAASVMPVVGPDTVGFAYAGSF